MPTGGRCRREVPTEGVDGTSVPGPYGKGTSCLEVIHFPNLEIKTNPMHFKWFYYVEYSESNGIFNSKNNDEILSVPHLYILTAIHHDLSNKRPFFKTYQNNKKHTHPKSLDQEQCSTLYMITPG